MTTRVLLVDDEPELLEAQSFALEYVGYEVECARGGEEALAAMHRRLPDVLITDLMMPGMSGEALCRAARDNPQWAHLPIVLHTSAHIEMHPDDAPWNVALRKPAHMDVFLATIAELSKGK
jgi:CheY-like chemotaxis protein